MSSSPTRPPFTPHMAGVTSSLRLEVMGEMKPWATAREFGVLSDAVVVGGPDVTAAAGSLVAGGLPAGWTLMAPGDFEVNPRRLSVVRKFHIVQTTTPAWAVLILERTQSYGVIWRLIMASETLGSFADFLDTAGGSSDVFRSAVVRLLAQCPLTGDEPAEQMLSGLSGDLFIPGSAHSVETRLVPLAG